MTVYEKIATMIFRIIGFSGILYSLLLIPYAIYFVGTGTLYFTFPFYFVGSLIFFCLAGIWAKIVCIGLKENE